MDEASVQGAISSPIQFQEAQRLPYLQACIKEALRLHPATGLPLARVVPRGGVVLSGSFFPEGVSLAQWHLGEKKADAILGRCWYQFLGHELQQRSVRCRRRVLSSGKMA